MGYTTLVEAGAGVPDAKGIGDGGDDLMTVATPQGGLRRADGSAQGKGFDAGPGIP